MKKNKFFLGYIGLCLALVSVGCDTTDSDISQNDLEGMLNEIVSLSASLDCTDASEWVFTEIGDKPCGGPAGYIAYSKQMDTMAFLAKVEAYTAAHRQYNIDNEIVSDCALDPPPVGIMCENNSPILIYNRCELLPDSGLCEAAITKYYFDQETQKCTEFLWGGCDGVVPFDTLEECLVCE